jgi:isocitrate dehydrogenase
MAVSFWKYFTEVATEYPELKADDVIVDDLCMKLVSRPESCLMWLF